MKGKRYLVGCDVAEPSIREIGNLFGSWSWVGVDVMAGIESLSGGADWEGGGVEGSGGLSNVSWCRSGDSYGLDDRENGLNVFDDWNVGGGVTIMVIITTVGVGVACQVGGAVVVAGWCGGGYSCQ